MESYSPSSKSESPIQSDSGLSDSQAPTSAFEPEENMEEFNTPETKLPDREEGEIPEVDLRAKLNARKSHSSRGEQPHLKKVRFEQAAEEKRKKTKPTKNQIGHAGTAGPRTGNPEGNPPSQEGQVPTKQLVEAIHRTLPDLREVTNAPQGDIPPISSTLRKIARVLGKEQKEGAKPRAVTGSDLPLRDTTPVGLPLRGLPQIKLVDLDESVKKAVKYLRYLNALLKEISGQPYVQFFDFQNTHVWLHPHGGVAHIDVAFQQQEYALLLLFHTAFKLPLRALRQPHQTFSIKQKVIPCAFVRPPWKPTVGPPSLRCLLVHGPGLRGQTIQDLADKLATEVLVNEEGRQRLGQLVDRIRKGSNRESPHDAALREVVLLEAVSREAAEQIINNPYEWGTHTEVCWLPSKALGEEATRREVAVVDYDQQLLVDHRHHMVAAITSHMTKITATTTKLCSMEDIFQLHVGTRHWPPSSYADPASLLQWKRNRGTKTVNFYARFTDKAYETLLVTGKQTVRVQAGVNEQGKHIEVPVVIEVGQWSEKGSRPSINRQPNSSGPTDHLTKAAEEAIAKVEERAVNLIQQGAAATGGATPETKELLKSINDQLSKWGEAEPVTAADLGKLHEQQEVSADRRHRELKH
ncbi:hypothetical protein CYMTET_52556, partial [Cymbomonas tetramitiformis]